MKDPTDPIREQATRYPDVDEGTACTQSSFKANKKSFLFVGMQGGRYKLMFKLKQSVSEFTKLAKKEPDNFGIGSAGWASARFTAEKPLAKELWSKWLDESYALAMGGKPASKKASKKKAAKKTATKKKVTKKTAKKAAKRSVKKVTKKVAKKSKRSRT